VQLQTVCLRHVPPGTDSADAAALREHNLAIARRVNTGGTAYLTPSVVDGVQLLRVSIATERTELRHVESLWAALQAAAAA